MIGLVSDNISIAVEWLEAEGLAEARIEALDLRTSEDVDRWRTVLDEQLRAVHEEHGRFALLVCVDNVRIAPQVANEYGKAVMEVVHQYVTETARYGSPGMVRALIAAEAIGKKFPANLFRNREEALDFLTS